MLQKSGKAGYNKLSRRQVLKTLGCGVGLVALKGLAGCTTLSPNIPTSIKERSTALSTAALARNRLHQVAQKIKSAVQALNIWRKNGQMPPGLLAKVKAARDATLDLFTYFDEAGVSKELDTQLSTLAAGSHIELPKERISLIWAQLQEMGFSEKDPEVRPWLYGIDLTEQVKAELHNGISQIWKKIGNMMNQFITILEQMQPAQPQMCAEGVVPLCGGGGGSSSGSSGGSGPGVGAYLGCATAILSAAAVTALLIAVCGPLVVLCPELGIGAIITAEGAILGCVAALTPG